MVGKSALRVWLTIRGQLYLGDLVRCSLMDPSSNSYQLLFLLLTEAVAQVGYTTGVIRGSTNFALIGTRKVFWDMSRGQVRDLV